MTCLFYTFLPSNDSLSEHPVVIIVAIWFRQHSGTLCLRPVTCGNFCSVKFPNVCQPSCHVTVDSVCIFLRCNAFLLPWISFLQVAFITQIYSLWLTHKQFGQHALPLRPSSMKMAVLASHKRVHLSQSKSPVRVLSLANITWWIVKTLIYHIWFQSSCYLN
jgi:hypothetical protein